jgi:hypothetical protein
MNFKTTSLLFGLLIAMLLVFGIAVQVPRSAADRGAVFPSIAGNRTLTIETVVLDRGAKETLLVKTDKGWRLKEPPATQQARADEGRVDQIIDEVRTARRVEEAVVTSDLAKVGLDRPALKVTLKEKGAGRQWTLNVGDKSADKQYVYVTSSDRPREVMAVSESSLKEVFFDNPDELRARTLLDVTDSNAEALRLTEPSAKEKRELALEKTTDGPWLFKVPAYYGAADFAGAPPAKEKGEPGVKGLVNSLAGVRVEDVKDFEPLGGRPLDHYGLAGGKETLRVEVEHAAGLLGSGKAKTIKEVLLVGSKVKDQYYVRLEQDDSVARVNAKKLEMAFNVLQHPEILRSRDLTHVGRAAVDAVDVRWSKAPKQEMQLLRGKDTTLWLLYEGGKKQGKANETAVAGDRDSLLTALQAQGKITPADYFDAPTAEDGKKLDAKLGFDSPVAEVKLYTSGVKEKAAAKAKETTKEKDKGDKDKAAKEKKELTELELAKDAKPAVTLIFGKTDKDKIYVKSLADKLPVTRVAVPASILEKVMPAEGDLAYLDTSLPAFSVAHVVKLELDRGPGGKVVVEKPEEKAKEKDKNTKEEAKAKAKKEKAPAWQLVEPIEIPGRTAAAESQVNEVLETLAHLQVVKWVKKIEGKPAKGTLAEYGLEPPALSAIVTVKEAGDKTESFIYKFGKESGDEKTKTVYALQNKTDIVFQAHAAAVKTLREAELRDRTIFSFVADKVKEVHMSFWLQSVNVPLVLERKSDKTWTSLQPPRFDLDSRTADAFMERLAHLEAVRFVLFKGKIPADYKLGADDKNLKIDLKVEQPKALKEAIKEKAKAEPTKTYTLTVGAANADKSGYYATASTLPGVVFLAPREMFEPMINNVSYFSRTKQAAAK